MRKRSKFANLLLFHNVKSIYIALNVITSRKESYNYIVWNYNSNHQENKKLELKAHIAVASGK